MGRGRRNERPVELRQTSARAAGRSLVGPAQIHDSRAKSRFVSKRWLGVRPDERSAESVQNAALKPTGELQAPSGIWEILAQVGLRGSGYSSRVRGPPREALSKLSDP